MGFANSYNRFENASQVMENMDAGHKRQTNNLRLEQFPNRLIKRYKNENSVRLKIIKIAVVVYHAV